MNFIEAQIEAEDALELKLASPLTGPITLARRDGFAQGLGKATLGIRPERLRILGPKETAPIEITGTLYDKVYYGEVTHYSVAVRGNTQPLEGLSIDSRPARTRFQRHHQFYTPQ